MTFRTFGTASALAGCIFATSLRAQTQVTTDPVGFVDLSLLGSSDTLVAPPLTLAPVFIGLVQSAAGNSITVVGSPNWNANQFAPNHYYALIGSSVSNPKEGHVYTITGNSAAALTVDTSTDDLVGIPA